jgi:hypothetical protein
MASFARRSGILEGGPATLSAIAQQSELRYRQYFATGIEDGAIHFAGVVLEDPQFNDLFCEG